jgi:hypothetical protein
MYLVDTCVVSELRLIEPHPSVLAWFRSVRSSDLHLSSITIAELQRGIQMVRAKDPLFAEELESWLEEAMIGQFSILPFDMAAAREWGRMALRDDDKNSLDAMIAAIARTRDLTVVTRNVKDFAPLDTYCVNPFEYLG